MKIAVSTEGKELTSAVDLRFGRAKGFLVYDTGTGKTVYIDNGQNLDSAQGAGVQAAKTVIDAGADAVITGNVGPNAFTALDAANVKIYLYKNGNAGSAVEQFSRGELEMVSSATVEGHR